MASGVVMSFPVTFLGFCDDAGHFALDDKRAFLAHIADKFSGQEVALTVQSRSALRSLRANAYYWSCVVAAAAEESHQDENAIHTFWCEQCLPDEKKRLLFYNRLTNQRLQVDVDARRTSKLNGTKFYDYVENCRLWCQEWLGMTTEDPDPEYWRKRVTKRQEQAVAS